ncbi:ShlB/FhaC/HecB family hemolysin secretion/activation protein [Caballeronia telluris]|uniref:ShlB/FhaC/HecB family hemolysin secretion/activation protein n=1 Tax=Caballeronia telluris TaxID=326475 RepID=UPI001F192A6F|nr:ShlB/FhaC/HecB family hemolysin secretion/activation protein [Caballeronia telluris]
MARQRLPHVMRAGARRHRRFVLQGAPVLLLAFAAQCRHGVYAQIAQVVPNAGSTLREQQQQPAPAPPSSDFRLQVAPPPAAPPSSSPGGIRFAVNAFELSGNAIVTPDLLALLKDDTGPARSLDDLNAAAARITAFYRAHGYLVARAYVPPQTIDNGVVHIAISEGHFGRVELSNQSRTREAVLARFITPERLGDVIDEDRLARATLLMQDVSGTTGASATVSPGTAPGTSDLTLQVPSARPLSGSLQADNFGETSTGTARVIGAMQWNNPLGLGDQLGARVLTSITGQTYGNIGYTLPLGGSGLAWGVAYTRSTYVVGGDFSSLDAHGSANVVSTYLSYPLLRSVSANVIATLGIDHKLLADNLGAFDISNDKNSDVGRFGLTGNVDFAKSISTFDASLQQGNLRLDDPAPQQAVAQTAGAFTKLVYAFTHTQALTDATQVYVAVNGQFTSRNLDSSEQMSLGGPYAVRAYATGDGALDQGWVATFELRQTIRQSLVPGLFTLIGFIDTGDGKLVAHPFLPGSNHLRLSGGGVGASLIAPGNYLLMMSYAHTLGFVPSTLGTGHANRFWLTLAKSF